MHASMCVTWRARNRNQSQQVLWPSWNWCMWCTLNWIIINRQRGGCVPRWMWTFDLLFPQHHKTRRQLQMLFDCCLLHASQPKGLRRWIETGNRLDELFQNKDLMTHTEHYNCCFQRSQDKQDSVILFLYILKSLNTALEIKKQRTMTLFFCCSPNA